MILQTRLGPATRARGLQDDFVFLEIRGLEPNRDPVRQSPDRQVQLLDRTFLHDHPRFRCLGHEGLVQNGIDVGLDVGTAHRGENPLVVRLRRNPQARLLNAVGDDHPVGLVQVGPRDLVHLVEGDRLHQLLGGLVLELDTRYRLALEKVRDVLACEATRRLVLPVGKDLLQSPDQIQFLALQLARREAVASRPLRFYEQRLEAALVAVFRHRRRELKDALRTHESAATGARPREGGVCLLGELLEAIVHHPAHERLDQTPAVLAHGRDSLGVLHRKNRDLRSRRLRIRSERVVGLGVVGDLVVRTLQGRLGHWKTVEMRLDQSLDLHRIEIAHRHDGHEIGPVPHVVEARQILVREVLQHLHGPDREAVGIARAPEHDRELLVEDARAGPTTSPPLFDHDPPLLVDLLRIEAQQVGPVLQDLERRGDDLRIVCRHTGKHVGGLIEARTGIDRRTKRHADRLEVVDELLFLEVLRPVERHVLH